MPHFAHGGQIRTSCSFLYNSGLLFGDSVSYWTRSFLFGPRMTGQGAIRLCLSPPLPPRWCNRPVQSRLALKNNNNHNTILIPTQAPMLEALVLLSTEPSPQPSDWVSFHLFLRFLYFYKLEVWSTITPIHGTVTSVLIWCDVHTCHWVSGPAATGLCPFSFQQPSRLFLGLLLRTDPSHFLVHFHLFFSQHGPTDFWGRLVPLLLEQIFTDFTASWVCIVKVFKLKVFVCSDT